MKVFEIHDAEDHITEDAVSQSATTMVPAGSVLIVIRSGILRHTLPVAVTRLPVALNQDLKALTPHSTLHPAYIAYGLRSFAQSVLHYCTKGGTTVQSVEFPALKRFEIPLAPRQEQERITDALDELFSDLDAGLAALERVREKLNLYRASVLKAAVEGALTAEWRTQHPNTEPASKLLERILAERRRRWEEDQLAKFKAKDQTPPRNWNAKYREPVTHDTSLPSLPEEWCWATLDQIAEIVGGVTKGQKFSSDQITREVPYLRVANVQRGFLDLVEIKTIRASESDIKQLRLECGDVLFNEGGDRDKLGRGWIWQGEIAECIHQNHVFRARLVSVDVQPKVISWAGNSYGQRWFLREGKQSVNLASINMTVLRSFPVPLAPPAEQEVIVEAVEDQLSVIDHLEADLDAKLKNALSLRQAILRHAFSGQLVPQDPNDEPASELLKRIAAEREERARAAASAKQTRRKPQPTQRERTRAKARRSR